MFVAMIMVDALSERLHRNGGPKFQMFSVDPSSQPSKSNIMSVRLNYVILYVMRRGTLQIDAYEHHQRHALALSAMGFFRGEKNAAKEH